MVQKKRDWSYNDVENKLFSIRLFCIKLTKLKIQDLELICRVFIGDYSTFSITRKVCFALVSDFVHVSINRISTKISITALSFSSVVL